MKLVHALLSALYTASAMGWEILWGLVLGFTVSAAVDVLVSKAELQKILPDASPRSVERATLLGAASSSCSYAAVAIARSIFRKGGDFTAAMAFQFASTNLVIEMAVLLVALMGWSFAGAELLGGPLMIVFLVLMFRALLRPRWVAVAREQADKGLPGKMEGHAAMATMAKTGSWRQRLASGPGWTAISHGFVMNWSMLWKDIAVGLLISGALATWIPQQGWQSLFLSGGDPLVAAVWGAVLGPLIALLSFTCSIGNIPLAAVLWNGGISFGGVVAFLFGDLIIPPILNIYRKYYGSRMSLFLLATFYVAMVLAALIVEGVFQFLDWVPAVRQANVGHAAFRLNYTTVLNVLSLLLAGALYLRYRRTGGPQMMREMKQGSHDHAGHPPHARHDAPH
ncbi:MAG: permease [Betaproteobacteria bacterium]|nr:permease [Betaproteobacteria bacterium]